MRFTFLRCRPTCVTLPVNETTPERSGNAATGDSVLIKASLGNRKMHFTAFKRTVYAAIFKNDYAMPKQDDIFGKYGPNDIRQRARSGYDHFNDAHRGFAKN